MVRTMPSNPWRCADFLESVRLQPERAVRFQQDLAVLKWFCFVVLALLLTVVLLIEGIDYEKILNLIWNF